MKVFVIIFSFYLLGLAAMACSDEEDCKYSDSQLSAFAETDHSGHDDDTENCSNFCMCACCGQSITNLYYPVSINMAAVAVPDFPTYYLSFVPEVYLSFWKPPKIS